jgi:hypothetical protein
VELHRFQWLYHGTEIDGMTHAHKPTPLVIGEDVVRIYFGVRLHGKSSRTYCADFLFDGTSFLRLTEPQMSVDIGPIGSYDDSGTNVSSILRLTEPGKGAKLLMYSIG